MNHSLPPIASTQDYDAIVVGARPAGAATGDAARPSRPTALVHQERLDGRSTSSP